MNKPHKQKPHVHADLIKAWADGAEIEVYVPYFGDGSKWIYTKDNNPSWDIRNLYRIKPQKKTMWINVYSSIAGGVGHFFAYSTRSEADEADEADRFATRKRIACVEVSYVEGEGLNKSGFAFEALQGNETHGGCNCS